MKVFKALDFLKDMNSDDNVIVLKDLTVDEKGNSFLPASLFFGNSDQKIEPLITNYLTLSCLKQMENHGMTNMRVRVNKNNKFDNYLEFRFPKTIDTLILQIMLCLHPTSVRLEGEIMALVW